MHLINLLLKTIFPTFCIGCGSYGDTLCKRCRNQLYVALPECFYCRRLSKAFLSHKYSESFSENRAGETSENPPETSSLNLSQVYVCYIYNWIGKVIMKKLKFEAVTTLQDKILSLIEPRKNELFETLSSNGSNTYIIPIPLSKKRVISRGYNQIEFFAKYLSRAEIGKYNDHILVRTDSSKSQSHKTLAERQFEGENPFRAIHETLTTIQPDQKLYFIIVDDVITTGATLKYAATALSQQYPDAEIKAIALFRPTFKGKREAPVLPDASTLPP